MSGDYNRIYEVAFNAFINGQEFTSYEETDEIATKAVKNARIDASAYLRRNGSSKTADDMIMDMENGFIDVDGNPISKEELEDIMQVR